MIRNINIFQIIIIVVFYKPFPTTRLKVIDRHSLVPDFLIGWQRICGREKDVCIFLCIENKLCIEANISWQRKAENYNALTQAEAAD